MADYTYGDALDAILAPGSDPIFWLSLTSLAVVMAVLVIVTPKPQVDEKRLAAIEKCRRETNHQCNRRPNAPLRRSWYQRLPGLYSEQTCMCQTRQRIRWLGGPNSARAIAFRNSQP